MRIKRAFLHPAADVAACIGFFTRLPVPLPLPVTVTERPFAASLWAAPVAGAAIGFFAGLILLAAMALGIPVSAASLLALAASVAITGALHEDGLADMADGCGGATRENKLAIMRDSRIGSYGVLALILSALARWTALDAIASASTSAAIVLALIAAHTASRAVLPAFMAYVPVARTDGLSAGFGTVPQQAAVIALGLGFLALIPLGLGFAIFTAALLLANFFLMDWFCRRQIGGQTGDVLGALQQTSEIAVFFILAGFLK